MAKKTSEPKELKYAAQPDEPIGDEVGRLAELHLKRIVKLVDGVKSGDIEAVHDMRTATRRIRAMIRLARDLDDGKELKSIAKFAKKLGGALGLVRADDVLFLGLKELGEGEAIRAIQLSISMRRAREAESLVDLLDSPKFDEWMDAVLDQIISNLRKSDAVREFAAESIESAFADVEKHRDIADDAPLPEVHELRIDSKQFRYVLEFFGKSTTWDAVPTLKRLVQLQDGLGALHDDELLLDEIKGAMEADVVWTAPQLDELASAMTQVEERMKCRRLEAPRLWKFLFEKDLLRI